MRWGAILAWTPSMWCMCGPRGEINTRHFLYLAVNFRFENGLKRQKATRFNFRFTPKWNCPKILQMFPRPQKHKSKVQRRGKCISSQKLGTCTPGLYWLFYFFGRKSRFELTDVKKLLTLDVASQVIPKTICRTSRGSLLTLLSNLNSSSALNWNHQKGVSKG